MHVSNVAMTTDTRSVVRRGMFRGRAFNHFNDTGVTFSASIVGDLLIAFGDLNRIRIVARREIERMPEAVLRLGGILANEISRRVAVITGRYTAMARLDPTIILILHDMAIHASLGIIGHVRAALGIDERESTHPERNAKSSAENRASDGRAFHLTGD